MFHNPLFFTLPMKLTDLHFWSHSSVLFQFCNVNSMTDFLHMCRLDDIVLVWTLFHLNILRLSCSLFFIVHRKFETLSFHSLPVPKPPVGLSLLVLMPVLMMKVCFKQFMIFWRLFSVWKNFQPNYLWIIYLHTIKSVWTMLTLCMSWYR